MDLKFVLPHLISGYIPVTAALALYFLALRLMGKKQSAPRIVASYVFCLYLVGILTVTGICFPGAFSPRIVYIPFVDMIRGPTDTLLNVLLFVPLGIFLPALYKNYHRIGKVALAGLLISASVEAAQLFGSGATDINDLITNTIGTCLGFGIYRILHRAVPKAWIRRIRTGRPQFYYELPLFWTGSAGIMLTVQVWIFRALFAAHTMGGEIQIWQ